VKPIKILKQVGFKKLFKAFLLALSHPLFVLPTFWATKSCMAISTSNYQKLHFKNGPENAFRHALWNYLIAKRCYTWRQNIDTVVIWTKKITDWHENAFPNKALAKKMDLHNNTIGRFLFIEHIDKTETEVVEILVEMTKISSLITLGTHLKEHHNKLVHINENEG